MCLSGTVNTMIAMLKGHIFKKETQCLKQNKVFLCQTLSILLNQLKAKQHSHSSANFYIHTSYMIIAFENFEIFT